MSLQKVNRRHSNWRMPARWFVVIGIAWFPTIPGCRPDEKLSLVPVTGQVFFEGKPAVGAVVTLHHLDPSVARRIQPTGIVEANGSFKIGTYDDEDGAPPGNYKATFEWSGSTNEAEALPETFSSPRLSNFNVKVSASPTKLPPFEFHKAVTLPAEKPDFMP